MRVLQLPISDKHLNAMFFNGIIAYHTMEDGRTFVLHTDSIGEIYMLNEKFVRYSNDDSINVLAILGLLNDEMLIAETEVNIHVDAWFGISELVNGELIRCNDEIDYDNHEEVINIFSLLVFNNKL